jgi:hypothetical protein
LYLRPVMRLATASRTAGGTALARPACYGSTVAVDIVLCRHRSGRRFPGEDYTGGGRRYQHQPGDQCGFPKGAHKT